MANPFFNPNSNANRNSSMSINDIYNLLSKSKNPYEVFSNLAKNNPNMAPIMNLLQNGYSPEQVFNMLCQQRGVNPQEFINNITR